MYLSLHEIDPKKDPIRSIDDVFDDPLSGLVLPQQLLKVLLVSDLVLNESTDVFVGQSLHVQLLPIVAAKSPLEDILRPAGCADLDVLGRA